MKFSTPPDIEGLEAKLPGSYAAIPDPDGPFNNPWVLSSSFLLGSKLWDVNAQPKMFHRSFMKYLDVAPHDFSLDLYVLFVANRLGMKVQSFPVFFAKREFGEAKGGGSLKGKYKLIKRTFAYIFQLRKDIKQGIR